MSGTSPADAQTDSAAPCAFRGAVLHTPVRGALELLRDALLASSSP
jgi:hypothetical protein